MGLFSKKEKDENLICDYSVIYLGGLPEYPKSKSSSIDFLIFKDKFELKPTFASKSWFNGLTINFGSISDLQIVERQVGTIEGILGGLNSRQLNQPNNINITYNSNGQEIVLRIEMLSGITVMGQAKKCIELEDRLRTNGIRNKFIKVTNPITENNILATDIPTQLEKLANLLEKGILTKEEFDAKKLELLAKM